MKFEFNSNGVCINPAVHYFLQNERCTLLITLAEIAGKCGFGIKVEIYFGNHFGTSWGVSQKRLHYDSQQTALLAATDQVAGLIKHEKSQHEPQHHPDFACFADFYKYHQSLRQLSIF